MSEQRIEQLKLFWRRFFVLAGWIYRDIDREMFHFIVTFPCNHSECSGSHSLLVQITDLPPNTFPGKWEESFQYFGWDEPTPAFFGDGPENTYWQMCHGSGGGQEDVFNWVRNAYDLWQEASQDYLSIRPY